MFSGMPPPGVYPGAVLPESRPPLPIHPNAAAEAAAARNLPNIDEDELEAAAAAIEAEAAAAEVDAAKRRADEAEQARLRSKAWTAHKSAEGQVYYHNSLTGESSWDKPAGFTGDNLDHVIAVIVGPMSWLTFFCGSLRLQVHVACA